MCSRAWILGEVAALPNDKPLLPCLSFRKALVGELKKATIGTTLHLHVQLRQLQRIVRRA